MTLPNYSLTSNLLSPKTQRWWTRTAGKFPVDRELSKLAVYCQIVPDGTFCPGGGILDGLVAGMDSPRMPRKIGSQADLSFAVGGQ